MIGQILIMYSSTVTAFLFPILAHFFLLLLFGARLFSEYPNKNKLVRQKNQFKQLLTNANLVIHERAYT